MFFFDIIVNFIIQNLKSKHFPQKIYKLSKTNIFFSRFEGTRGEKTKYFAPKTTSRKNMKSQTMISQIILMKSNPSH